MVLPRLLVVLAFIVALCMSDIRTSFPAFVGTLPSLDTPEEIFCAGLAYQKLGLESPKDWCKKGANTKGLTKETSPLDFLHVVSNNLVLKCGQEIPSDLDVEALVRSWLESSVTPADFFAASRHLMVQRTSLEGLTSDKKFLQKHFSRVVKMMKKSTASLLEDAQLLESAMTLGRAAGLKKDGKSKLISATKNVQGRLLSLHVGAEGAGEYAKAAAKLSTLLKKNRPLDLRGVQTAVRVLVALAESETSSLATRFAAIDALHAVSAGSLKPFLIGDAEDDSAKERFLLHLTDVFGAPLVGAAGVTVSVGAGFVPYDPEMEFDETDVAYLENVPAVASPSDSSGTYVVEYGDVSDKVSVATNLVFLAVSESGYRETAKILRPLAMSVSNIRVKVLENTKRSTSEGSIELTDWTKPIPVDPEVQRFIVTFDVAVEKGRPFTPDQAIVRVTGNGQDRTFSAKEDQSRPGHFGVVFYLETDSVFKNVPGVYYVDVIIGDATFETAFVHRIGALDYSEGFHAGVIYEESFEEEKYALSKPIEHMFQAAPVQAGGVIANAFSALVVLPGIVFLVGLLRFCDGFVMPSGLGLVYHLLFFLCVAGAVATIVLFWLEISVFQAFYYLLLCLVVGVFVGSQALRRTHEERKASRE